MAYMTLEDIAKVCHDVNKSYCSAIGEEPYIEWEQMPEQHRTSYVEGVKMHLLDPNTTPEMAHNAWLESKKKDGWKHGPVKDLEKKEHPLFVVYSEVPISQRVKDYLFRQVVHSLKGQLSPLSDYGDHTSTEE